MAGKSYVIKDNSGAEFWSNGLAKIGGLTVDMRKPERLNVLNTTIDLFRHTPIQVTNSVYNRIGYGIVASQNTGGEVLYPIQKLRDGVQSTGTNDNRFNYDMYSIRKNEGVKLQGCYLVRDTNGRVAWIRGKNNKNSNINPPNGASPSDYVFSIDGTGRAVNTKTKETTTWGYELIEKKNDEGTKINHSTKSNRTKDQRVQQMQQALNAAGYTDQNGRKLADDGLIGPKTEFAAQQAGIDPKTWNGTPAIKPKSQGQQGGSQISQQTQPQGGEQPVQSTHPTQPAVNNTPTTFNRQEPKFNMGMYQQSMKNVNAEAERQKVIQQQQQARTNLLNQVNSLKKRLAPVDDRKLDQIMTYVDSGNYAAATELAKRVSGGGHTIQPLITSLEASMKPSMNEIKERFYDIFDRMNNATILQ